jgi:hypothetical protein
MFSSVVGFTRLETSFLRKDDCLLGCCFM